MVVWGVIERSDWEVGGVVARDPAAAYFLAPYLFYLSSLLLLSCLAILCKREIQRF